MKKTLTFCCILLLALVARTQVVLPVLEAEDFMEGFTSPLGIENCGDERLFIVEQGGKVWITYPDGSKLEEPFLDLSDKVYTEGSEQGLLGLTFDPDFETNGYVYTFYTAIYKGNVRISRFTIDPANPNTISRPSELVILRVKHPFENHNAGQLRFGPDGYLYIGMGDGGDAGDPYRNAQNPGSLLGKMLRIDVHGAEPYSIPESNPFVMNDKYMPEIWDMGLRNPWRFSFDRLTGDLWIADVGQNKWEEINFEPAGSNGGYNYGWDCREGTHRFQPDNCGPAEALTNPIYDYSHREDDCTVVGGFVYRGTLYPNMFGKYFYNDYCSGRFAAIYQDAGEWVSADVMMEEPFEYVTFGEDMHGELYVADIAGGEIYKLIDISDAKTGFLSEFSHITLYPNPSDGVINLKWIAGSDEEGTIEISNLYGQTIFAEPISVVSGVNNWNYSNIQLNPGNYFIKLHTGNSTLNQPFVVQ